MFKLGLLTPLGSRGGLACTSVRLYSQEMRIIKSVDTAHLRRGTGGRSSFNGQIVTVFGATGFLGPYIVNQLGKRGAQIIIPYRGSLNDINLEKLKLCGDLGQVLFQPFNLKDPVSIRKAIKYSNVVINLIGRDFESKNFNFYEVHVKGAKNIAAACKELNVERLIHFSSLNVTENPEKYYMKKLQFLPTKLKGEEAVLNEYPSATIFRPAAIFGFFDRFLWPLLVRERTKFMSTPLYAKGEKTIRQPVFGSDVAQGVVNAINDYDSRGKIFQAVGPERFYLKDILLFCAQVLQRINDPEHLIHDIKYDFSFIAKLFFLRNITGIFYHQPNRFLAFEYIERESVSDKVNPDLPTLLDLGVPLTKFEDRVPGLIFPFFIHRPTAARFSHNYIPPESLSPKAVNDYSC